MLNAFVYFLGVEPLTGVGDQNFSIFHPFWGIHGNCLVENESCKLYEWSAVGKIDRPTHPRQDMNQ